MSAGERTAQPPAHGTDTHTRTAHLMRAHGWLGSSRSSHLLRWACSGARHTWSRTHLCSAPRRRATSASSLPTYAWHGLGLRAVRHGMRHGMRLDMVSAALLGIPCCMPSHAAWHNDDETHAVAQTRALVAELGPLLRSLPALKTVVVWAELPGSTSGTVGDYDVLGWGSFLRRGDRVETTAVTAMQTAVDAASACAVKAPGTTLTHMNTCLQTPARACAHTRLHIATHTHTRARAHARFTATHTHTHTLPHTLTHSHTHPHTRRSDTHTRARTHTLLQPHTRTYASTHAHARVTLRPQPGRSSCTITACLMSQRSPTYPWAASLLHAPHRCANAQWRCCVANAAIGRRPLHTSDATAS